MSSEVAKSVNHVIKDWNYKLRVVDEETVADIKIRFRSELEDAHFSYHIKNAIVTLFNRGGISSLSDLSTVPDGVLLSFPYLGPKTLAQIREQHPFIPRDDSAS